MGFLYYGYGEPEPCGVSNGKVYWTTPAGKRLEYATTLDVEIEEQCNKFLSNTVLFDLRKDGKQYIGLKNGAVQIYDELTGLLLGSRVFDLPGYIGVRKIGYWTRHVNETYVVYLNTWDNLTVYTLIYRTVGVLDKPINRVIKERVEDAECETALDINIGKILIYGEDGELRNVTPRPISPEVRSQTCTLYF